MAERIDREHSSKYHFRRDKGILMRWIALPYLLIFDVMSPILWLIYMLKELVDLAIGRVYTHQEVTSWIIILALSFAIEVTIDMLTYIEQSDLDHEKLRVVKVFEILFLQVPKMALYMFVIIPARTYGTITYLWRKNVW